MSKQNAKKKRVERLLVRDFLQHAGIPYEPWGLYSVLEQDDVTGPDVSISCPLPGGRKRIGIELTDYQNDLEIDGKGSLGRKVHKCFRAIKAMVWQQQEECPEIKQVVGMVFFDREGLPRKAEYESVATELIQFVKDHLQDLPGTGRTFFKRTDEYGNIADFAAYPLLAKHFKELMLELFPGIGPITWAYDNATNVGIDKRTVEGIIASKAAKLPSYDRTNTEETWLLICAGISLPTDSAGPRHHSERALADAGIRRAASQSGFDRVVFWEQRYEWHVDLA